MKTVKIDEVIWREDLYPRQKQDASLIQRYSENLSVLPPIEVNQHCEIIDGLHRWKAHKLAQSDTISVEITKTASDIELLSLACLRNGKHGLQLSEKDKHNVAIRLYNGGVGINDENE